MGDYPEKAQGMGGRQVRVGPDTGQIYDHHAVEFTYANGHVMLSQCRHQRRAWSHIGEYVKNTMICLGRFRKVLFLMKRNTVPRAQ